MRGMDPIDVTCILFYQTNTMFVFKIVEQTGTVVGSAVFVQEK